MPLIFKSILQLVKILPLLSSALIVNASSSPYILIKSLASNVGLTIIVLLIFSPVTGLVEVII